jgi:diguanylate cyclase
MLSVFPENDHNQTLRIKRFLMAFASYVMWSAFTVLGYSLGLTRVPLVVLVTGISGCFLVNMIVYAIFRTGINKKFHDQSLTLLQMVIATFWAMVVVYYADSVRSVVLLVYLVVFVFGLFRLSVRQFLFLSAFAVVNYAAVIFLLSQITPESLNPRVDILNIIVLATVLPWFSMIGGYISSLRRKLSRALVINERLAIIDDLTQVYNRRQMYNILDQQKALGDRGVYPFSICIFDLDHFKKVNDTFGHAAGDGVLKTVAQEVQKNLRDIDHIARYGGEEFIIILINSERPEALICAERVREVVKNLVFENLPRDFRITISVGVTEYQPTEVIQKAINRADMALYRAKTNGRNRVEYEEPIRENDKKNEVG